MQFFWIRLYYNPLFSCHVLEAPHIFSDSSLVGFDFESFVLQSGTLLCCVVWVTLVGLPCWLEEQTFTGNNVQHNFISSAGFGFSFNFSSWTFWRKNLKSGVRACVCVCVGIVGRKRSIYPLILLKEVLFELRSCRDQIPDCGALLFVKFKGPVWSILKGPFIMKFILCISFQSRHCHLKWVITSKLPKIIIFNNNICVYIYVSLHKNICMFGGGHIVSPRMWSEVLWFEVKKEMWTMWHQVGRPSEDRVVLLAISFLTIRCR